MNENNLTDSQQSLLTKAIASGGVLATNGSNEVTLTIENLEKLKAQILAKNPPKVALPKAIDLIVNRKKDLLSINRSIEAQSDCC